MFLNQVKLAELKIHYIFTFCVSILKSITAEYTRQLIQCLVTLIMMQETVGVIVKKLNTLYLGVIYLQYESVYKYISMFFTSLVKVVLDLSRFTSGGKVRQKCPATIIISLYKNGLKENILAEPQSGIVSTLQHLTLEEKKEHAEVDTKTGTSIDQVLIIQL